MENFYLNPRATESSIKSPLSLSVCPSVRHFSQELVFFDFLHDG